MSHRTCMAGLVLLVSVSCEPHRECAENRLPTSGTYSFKTSADTVLKSATVRAGPETYTIVFELYDGRTVEQEYYPLR